jgi:hypothetical protein
MVMPTNKKRLIIPPAEGWKSRAYYIIEVAYSAYNPIHRCMYFSGFLSRGEPNGYSGVMSSDNETSQAEFWYMRVLYQIAIEDHLNLIPAYHAELPSG